MRDEEADIIRRPRSEKELRRMKRDHAVLIWNTIIPNYPTRSKEIEAKKLIREFIVVKRQIKRANRFGVDRTLIDSIDLEYMVSSAKEEEIERPKEAAMDEVELARHRLYWQNNIEIGKEALLQTQNDNPPTNIR